MDERTQAAQIADRLLDEPYADPDDDVRVVCRQFNRQGEELQRYKNALRTANGFLIMHNLEPVKLEYSSSSAGDNNG